MPQSVGGAIVFFLFYLTLTAARLPHLTAAQMKTNAASDDEPAGIILLITFVAAAAAVVSLFRVLQSDAADPLELALSLATVALGWFTIHTMTALHYAHLYWRPEDDPKRKDKRHRGSNSPAERSPAPMISSISPS